jgi:hypothetical protein
MFAYLSFRIEKITKVSSLGSSSSLSMFGMTMNNNTKNENLMIDWNNGKAEKKPVVTKQVGGVKFGVVTKFSNTKFEIE